VGILAAARTRRLRIGTAVSLAPFYHPLRLAEEVALLDVLSGGRVNWGAGRGFERSEFAAFGIAGEESASRFHERWISCSRRGRTRSCPMRGNITTTTPSRCYRSPCRRRTLRRGWRQAR